MVRRAEAEKRTKRERGFLFGFGSLPTGMSVRDLGEPVRYPSERKRETRAGFWRRIGFNPRS